MARITLDHLIGRLEAGVGDLGNSKLLVVGLLRGDDRGVRGQGEVDTGVRYEIRLELSQVHI